MRTLFSIPPRSRQTTRAAILAASLSLLALLAGPGCAAPGRAPEAPPATGPAAAGPAEPSFREVGEASLPRVIAPGDYILLGCLFASGPSLRGDLVLETPVSEAPEAARDDLARILAAVEGARRGGDVEPSSGAEARAGTFRAGEDRAAEDRPPPRAWTLAVASGWIADLEVAEAAAPRDAASPAMAPPAMARPAMARPLDVTARIDRKPLRVDAPAPSLLSFLRERTVDALERAATRPRIAEDWHLAAIAGLVALPGAETAGFLPPPRREELLGRILARLRDPSEARDPEPLVEAVLPIADIFDGRDLAPLAARGPVSLRLLGLAATAASGDAAALREILTLSLEYFGKERLFASALLSIFPDRWNPELRDLYPEAGASPVASAGLLQEVRARAGSATFRAAESPKDDGPAAGGRADGRWRDGGWVLGAP